MSDFKATMHQIPFPLGRGRGVEQMRKRRERGRKGWREREGGARKKCEA